MTEAVTVYDQGQVVSFDADRRKLLQNTYAKGISPLEFELFLEVCQRQGLDPFAKHIYAISRGGKMTIQVSIDGARLIASETGEYEGQQGPEWCGPDGIWRDVWLAPTPPAAARVGVMRRGFIEPTWGVATWKSFHQETPTWKGMPDVMLAKCAEMQALRKAFPQRLSNIFSAEEDGAGEYVAEAQAQREPKAPIKQPVRRSEGRRQQSEPPFGSDPPAADTETGEVIEGELVPAHRNDAPPANFGEFWNALPDLLAEMGKSLGDVGMNLNCEPSPAGLRKWYDMNDTDPIGAVRAALGVA